MKLRIYLVRNHLKIKDFCEIINYSRNQISGVISGKLRPSKKLANIIEKATGGEVTAAELLNVPVAEPIKAPEELKKEPKHKGSLPLPPIPTLPAVEEDEDIDAALEKHGFTRKKGNGNE